MSTLSQHLKALQTAIILVGFGWTSCAFAADVQKTNPMKVYMHYMPWFESPATLGGTNWGFHWQFNNRNPNVVDANGKRQIASHYYPKIGPYASNDPQVIEYHLLLMKLSGIDGVMINWYGQQGTNGDVANLLTNSNAIVAKTDDFGMKFGVVFEDRFAANIEQAKTNVRYLKDNYFNKPEYIRYGAGEDPLMFVFGPITFQQPTQWNQIIAEAGEPLTLLTLPYESNETGQNADGEFQWIWEDETKDNHLQVLTDFLNNRAPSLNVVSGVAYPGFNDYYQEGGLGNVVPFEIPHENGQTLAQTLALAQQSSSKIDMLQLATWNDFSEGTMFEPTVETGFDYLKQIQQFTGVPYGEDELQLVYRLYVARKEHAGNAATQALLDQASGHLNALEIEQARAVLDGVDPPGDFDNDGDADGADFLKWQQQSGLTGLFPLQRRAADANADGVVNGADLDVWKTATAAAGGTAIGASTVVPEPHAGALAAAAICCGVLWRSASF